MARGQVLLIGEGIQLGPGGQLNHLVYISNVGPPPVATTYGAQRLVDSVSAAEYTSIPNSAGVYLSNALNATEGLRILGGAIISGSGTDTVQIGRGASATGTDNVAIGRGAVASSNQSVVIGATANNNGQQGVIVGFGASFTSAGGVAIGLNAAASGNAGGALCVAIGTSSSAAGNPTGGGGSVAIGPSAVAKEGDVVIGNNASSNQNSALGTGNVVIGNGATSNVATGFNTVLGTSAVSAQKNAVAIGAGATASTAGKTRSIVIGQGSTVSGTDTIVIGGGSLITSNSSIAIGAAAVDLGVGVLQLGANGTQITTTIIGMGDTIAGPGAQTVRFTNGSGIDNPAAAVSWIAPRSTGAAAGGAHIFKVGQPGVSSSTVQTLATVLTLDATSTLLRANFGTSVIQGGAAPASSGFLNVDASSYSGHAIRANNGAVGLFLDNTGTTVRLYTSTTHPVNLGANNLDKWSVLADAAGTASLASLEATARIIGGATNGLAVRNNANTRDNFLVNDGGSTATLTDGTFIAVLATSGNSGETTQGSRIRGSPNVWMLPTGGTVGLQAGVSYFDGAIFRSALEVANAAGFGSTALMKSGGTVVIGGNGSTTVDTLTIASTPGAGNAALRFNGLTNGAGAALGTLGNAPVAGNPAFWIPINIAGTVRFVPAW